VRPFDFNLTRFPNQSMIPQDRPPFIASSPSGLRLEANASGSLRRLDHDDVMINLFLGNEAEGGLSNVYLRQLGNSVVCTPMIGPLSPAGFVYDESGVSAFGQAGDLVFRLRLQLAESTPAWFWHVEIENTGTEAARCDLVHTQDIGLAHYGAIRLNEFYVSHYIDHSPLDHAAHGAVVASRQNQSMGGRHPWTLIGSLGRAVSYGTDGLQFYNLAARLGGTPPGLLNGLPGKRLQHEHSLVALQDEAFWIEPGSRVTRGFWAEFVSDHPADTSPEDLSRVETVLALPEAKAPEWVDTLAGTPPARSLFATAPWFEGAELDEAALTACFGKERRHEEMGPNGLLSFFTQRNEHVVLRSKEGHVLRPHGHLLRSGGALTPDESALTSTSWMGGVFHSMVTQGHVSINRFLSTCHGYLGVFRSHGQRIFVEIEGSWCLLGLPSAFGMTLCSCRWIYQHERGRIEVEASAPEDKHELLLRVFVREGAPARFLVTHHVALNGDNGSGAMPAQFESDGGSVFVRAIPDSDVGRRFPDGGFRISALDATVVDHISGDALLYADGVSRNQPWVCFTTKPADEFGLRIEGCLVEEPVPMLPRFWEVIDGGLRLEPPAGSPLAAPAMRLAEVFPWFIHNALVHYLSPRGLEQFSGGGWGTRDVCQGPVELLLALGRVEPVRDLLCRVFRQQNADGDWPQWFMFFERERGIRPGDSHGDIVYWPLVALGQYLLASGDASLLEESLPFFHHDGDTAAEHATVLRHVERALSLIERRVIEGTCLAAYGHGDWNDSLQPAKPDMRERLCSAWTVTLNHQTLQTLAAACRCLGAKERAQAFEERAQKVLGEFQQKLVVKGVVTGLAYFHEHGGTDFLIHPDDKATGLSYSLLPMIHAIINDMFTPEQAREHLRLIQNHLLGPDGAHLFDKPLAYHGGLQRLFQRAETASYFGREIGLMYTHAHLRYCEALARHGDAEAFFEALCKANPIAVRESVPSAGLRQANCYYSSSDPAFADRYEAHDQYDRVNRGEVALEGGWRIYSSGAGIATRLIMQSFLGLMVEHQAIGLDPVIPASLDGLRAHVELAGHRVKVTYRIGGRGCGPLKVSLNGKALPFTRGTNPYRMAGVQISRADFEAALTANGNELIIELE
jgi:1,2-beta-oligoglucan phosphorylase